MPVTSDYWGTCVHEVRFNASVSQNDDGSGPKFGRLWMIWRDARDAAWRMWRIRRFPTGKGAKLNTPQKGQQRQGLRYAIHWHISSAARLSPIWITNDRGHMMRRAIWNTGFNEESEESARGRRQDRK